MLEVANYRNNAPSNSVLTQEIKVLIVDDVAINRLMVGKILDRCQIANSKASGALQAFEMISDLSYTHILMDLEMPEVNGFEATEFIRKLDHPYFKSINIIGLSAHRPEDVQEKAIHSGMNLCLGKPIHPDVLKQIILETYENVNS